MKAREKGTEMFKYTATNWNGRPITGEFKFAPKGEVRLPELVKRAHAALHREGYTTYRLDTIGDERIPYMFQYC